MRSSKRLFAAAVAGCLAALPATALADTLVYNVDGLTIDEEGNVERFVALTFDDDGKVREIVLRGEDRPSDVDYAVDGKGRVMLPGFIDAHLHVMGVGFSALTLDLSQTNSLEEALAAIAEFAAANPGRPWILGGGWNQEKWGLGRFPTAAELDAVVSDRPVYLTRIDGHAGWANSLAMEKAGVDASAVAPAGGRIERLAGSKTPSGIFVDTAESLVTQAIPAPRPVERDLAFAKAQDVLLSEGITAAADMGTSIEDWQTFRRAGDRGALKLRIMSYASSLESMQLIAGPGPTPWLYDDRLRMGGLKIYLDGALGSRGAWLKEDYADWPGNRGIPMLSPAQLRNIMSRAAMDGFQTAVHAIGDAANAEVLDAIEELSETYTGDRRWRVEHAQIVDPADLPRFAAHGTIASFQPLHQTSDRLMAEARMTPERLGGAYAWRSVLNAGGRIAFGSDSPVEPADVRAGLAVAISRTDANGEPFGGWRAQDAVSREQAIAAFSSDAAYAGFAEGRFGRLVPGERADFVLVDRDPMLSSPEQIRGMVVLETWIGGERVYARKGD